MIQARQIDWDAARATHPQLDAWLISAAGLEANRARGFAGEAYTCDSGRPTDVLFVQRTPFGEGTRSDLYLEAETESAAEALMDALDPTRQYFMSYPTTYAWRHVVERRLAGSRVWGKYHYRLDKATFRPRPYAHTRRIHADDEAVRAYHDEEDDQTVRAVTTSCREDNPCYGVFVAEGLVAVACTWADNVSWVHARADSRRMGRGSAAVSAAVASVLSRHECATYDADTGNEASIRLAGGLGFALRSETVVWMATPAGRADLDQMDRAE
ncbi:hypothetical protein HN371_06200 [Candidatus Poribacteria bacterium]|jgi:hypothetical protein|nr:hypothetical protein [Candidatus Poribacteria bacterium]MBT5532482.1 hypothetical protein [Candidatus Poribacteria bacterium]MBT5713613.1 hypothetical protein [Candidatus Poribacteria bacterium]MBT7804274.1 hypothetical protein [Candidatus Poribacteria bacterium]